MGQKQNVTEALTSNRVALNAFRAACIGALLTLSWEFLLDLFQMSGRRLWALARFSIKEAVHRKVLWSFLVLFFVFLFGSWFISTSRTDTQWGTYVGLVFFIITALVLVTASVVACFSLPTDIKHQTLHTVVTKPVLKFEIVLGRVLGLVILMSLVLLVAVHASLLYVFRGIDPQTRETALRARTPIFGSLHFEELNERGEWQVRERGDSVGREYELRQYIRGGSNQEAVWLFAGMPERLAARDDVAVEFAFDIFRTSKCAGDRPQEGVDIQIAFVNKNKWREARYQEYLAAKYPADHPRSGNPLTAADKAREFGYYQLPRPIRIVDEKNRQDRVTFPGTLLEGLEHGLLEVRVGCRSYAQYLGSYKYDLYVLDDEQSFYWNFLKGSSGIWFFMVIVVTLGVVFSTYLNAPVSLMLTWLLMICGLPRIRGFIETLTLPVDPTSNPGGGPLEAFLRLMRREALTTHLEPTRATSFLQSFDAYFFQYVFKGLYNIMPDLGQYERTQFIAAGFGIPGTELAMSCVILLLYLLPFLLAGYYLMNVREVAG
jgi:ABC-type transport system involved in multi-copper enzyme maturation permease subunit